MNIQIRKPSWWYSMYQGHRNLLDNGCAIYIFASNSVSFLLKAIFNRAQKTAVFESLNFCARDGATCLLTWPVFRIFQKASVFNTTIS